MKRLAAASLAVVLAVSALPAAAQSKGDWTLGLGLGYVMQKDDNGSLLDGTVDLDIGDNLRPTITAEYFFMDNLGVEILAAWPFEHSIMSSDLDGKVGATQQLPPTISRRIDIESDVKLNGEKVGTAEVDTWVLGLSYVMTF
jgi:outer membrane protein